MRKYVMLAAYFLGAIPASADDLSNNLAICKNGGNPDALIAACGGAIEDMTRRGWGIETTGETYLRRARAYQAKGDRPKALADFARACAHIRNEEVGLPGCSEVIDDPGVAVADRVAALHYRAKAYSHLTYLHNMTPEGDEFTARRAQDVESILKLDPKNDEALYLRGLHYKYNRRDLDGAIAAYDAAIKLERKADYLFARAEAFELKGETARALADYDEGLAKKPDDNFERERRARAVRDTYPCKEWQDYPPEGLAGCNRIIGRRDATLQERTDALQNRAQYFLSNGKAELAIADLTTAVHLNPRDPEHLYYRAKAYRFGFEDFGRAIEDIEAAIRLKPDAFYLYAERADIHRHAGNLERAIVEYEDLLRKEPDLDSLKEGIEEMRATLKKQAALPTAPSSADAGKPATPPAAAPRQPSQLESAAEPPASAVIAAKPAPAPVPAPSPATARTPTEKRVALVIGNAAYRSAGALTNPPKDAKAVASALRAVGFTSVTLANDVTREQLVSALRAFAGAAADADWAVLYFAGHGIEVAGTNYLLPVDAELKTDRDAQYEAVSLDQLMGSVERAKKLKLVVLDACRNNPFTHTMTRSVKTRSLVRGLGEVEPEGGTLVAYAAKAGQEALDGDDADNSPFASAFVRHLVKPDIEINKVFRLVRDEVLARTNRKQEPFVYGSLPADDFFFRLN